MMRQRCAIFIFLIFIGYSLDSFARNDELFPRPAAIEHDVQFWKRVYTEITTGEGFIHDDANLAVVYEKIRLPENVSRKHRSNYVKRIKNKYRKILHTLSNGKRTGLSNEERRVLALWPDGVSNRELRRAKDRIRFQLGQANKFRAGLVRSGAWKPYILDNLDKMGLPREIASLPHVESSFNHKAYSKVGAAGMWQFTRSTGRRFMRVDHVIDERMDPFIASVAAARLLENNYAVTGSWPLAMTAYNHGAAGMRRAAMKLGTTDITTVLRKYKSRTFGFASRNFYVAFLAAVEIDSNPQKYFGDIKLHEPVDYEFVKIPAYMSANTILDALNIPRAELMETNPALRPAVWNGNKYIPKGYELRINRKTVANAASAHDAIAKIASKHMYAKQRPDRYHRVRRGQPLSTIAARYGVRARDIQAVNNLRSRNRIYVGQVLRLPQGKGEKQISRQVQVAQERSPKVEPRALPASGTYKVKRGDTIDRIARRYGMSPKELQSINNLRNKNKIYPGQRLVLNRTNGATYIVKRGDSIDLIAKRHGKDPKELLALNNIRNKHRIYPGQRLILGPQDSDTNVDTYIVKRGDSIEEIAKRHGKAPRELLALNNISNKNRIYPGQQIILAKSSEAKVPDELKLPETPEPFPSESDQDNKGEVIVASIKKENLRDEDNLIKTPTVEDSEKQIADESIVVADDEENLPTADGTEVENTESDDRTTAADNDSSENSDSSESGDSTSPQLANISPEVLGIATDGNGNAEEDSLNNPGESIGDAAISESETDLLADPTDYSVSKRNTIEVQAAETLGHYAEWLQLRASDLRRINRMRYGKPVVVGKRLKLKFTKVTPEEFEEQRVAYHRALQEEFFEQYQITGSDKHKIRRGQSVWKLTKRTYKIPLWLLRQYNPDLDMKRVRPGTIITFPKIERRTDDNKLAPPDSALKTVASKAASS